MDRSKRQSPTVALPAQQGNKRLASDDYAHYRSRHVRHPLPRRRPAPLRCIGANHRGTRNPSPAAVARYSALAAVAPQTRNLMREENGGRLSRVEGERKLRAMSRRRRSCFAAMKLGCLGLGNFVSFHLLISE
jgi:hypothetical protein